MLPLLFVLVLCRLSWGQRYADRNPIPADPWPLTQYKDKDYDFTEGYGFEEEDDIYRWNVNDYPHPRENPRFCNRNKPSTLCDPDSVLQKEQAEKLDSVIQELYKKTPCICENCSPDDGGIVVGIALLKNMYQPYNEHPARIIRAFAETLRSNWKLGKCDNDILIVVATTDRLSYTDVGRATSSYLSIEEAHQIFLENKAHFTAGHFYEGLLAIISDYQKSTRHMKRPVQEELNIGLISGIIVGAVVLLGVLLFLAFVLYKICKTKKDPEKLSKQAAGKEEGVPSSWTKRDIHVMFSSLKPMEKQQSAKYQPCRTDEKDAPVKAIEEEEILDTSLAIPESTREEAPSSTMPSTVASADMLEQELTNAAEGIAQTFTTFQPKKEYKGHVTDL